MRRVGPVRALVVSLGLALLSSGCGSGSRPITENPLDGMALEDVGEAYRVFTIKNKRPPAKLDDLTPIEMLCPTGVRAMKQGDVVVFWGATLPDTGEEPGKTDSPEVLAYQKQVPEQGGYVLLLNRTIKKMTADEFKAAPKAGKN
jgi:hypothetical protein